MYGVKTALGGFTLSAALAALIFLYAPLAAAHARWDLNGVVKPRNTSTGLKTDPCGAARTTTPATFAPGQTLEVSFEETINHASHFRIAFSPLGDLNFNNHVLLDNIPDNLGSETPLPHLFRAVITLPAQTCDACTLQLIQVMTDNPAAPSNYYSCADIKLATGGTTPTPTPTSTPLPTPTPPPVLTDLKQIAQNLLDDFAVADADKSNTLTLDEAQSILPGLASATFNKLGANDNGTVSKAELNAVINPPALTNTSSAASLEWTALLGLLTFALQRRRIRLHRSASR